MNFEDLTPDMKSRARACKTPEEFLELAKENGYDLSDEELEQVSGGWGADANYEYYACSCDECNSLYCHTVRCDLSCSSFSFHEQC